MRRWLRGLAVVAAAVLLGPLGAAAAPKGRADVSAYNTDAGLRLVYELDRPTRQLRLALDESAVRDDTWSVVTPGLTLKDDVVSGEAPFRRVELLVRPMKGERDAIYPAVFRVGRGLVLYARYLHADPALYDTRIRFRPAAEETVVPREPARREGFVFIGPADAPRRQGAFDVVVGPGVPPWLLDEITDGLRDSSGVFEKALRVKPRRAGLVMVTYGEEGRGDVVADVTTGGVIAFRFHGKPWAERSPIGEARVRRLVPHEAFHLWNGELAHNAEGTPSWLHEGGAEYASLEAQVAAGHVSEAAAAERLTDDLGRCQRALGADSLTSTKRTDMGLRYPCGMVVQWLADLHARRASAGTRTVLTAWGDTVRLAQGAGGAYTLDQYWAATGMADPASRPEALRLLLGTGPGRLPRHRHVARAAPRLSAEKECRLVGRGQRASPRHRRGLRGSVGPTPGHPARRPRHRERAAGHVRGGAGEVRGGPVRRLHHGGWEDGGGSLHQAPGSRAGGGPRPAPPPPPPGPRLTRLAPASRCRGGGSPPASRSGRSPRKPAPAPPPASHRRRRR